MRRTWSRRHGAASARTVTGAAGSATAGAAGGGAQRAAGVERRGGRGHAQAHDPRAEVEHRAIAARQAQRRARRAARRRAGRRRRSPPPRRPRGACGRCPACRGGKAASRTSMRTVRARSGAGRATRAVGRHGQRRRRPAVGDHAHAGREAHAHRGALEPQGADRPRRSRAPLKPRAARADPAGDPRAPRVAVEGRRGAVAPQALEARGAVEGRRAARRRPSASSTWSGVSGATLTHASARHARAAGGAIARAQPRSPSCWSRTRPRERAPVTTFGRSGSSPVVRSKRYVSPARRRSAPCSACSTSSGGRSASVARTPGMRSSRMPPAPPSPVGGWTTCGDPHAQRAHAAQAQRAAGSTRRARRTARPLTATRSTRP